jgi:pimeloyl-ACP methyl ester carboxylesterase
MPYTCHPLLALVKEVILVSRCIGLDTHILDIIQVLEDENLSEVFLVGHSYGGLVIGGAADKIPQRIRHLVYLDAYIPQDNKSVFDLESGLETVYTKRALKKRSIEWLFRLINRKSLAYVIVLILTGELKIITYAMAHP